MWCQLNQLQRTNIIFTNVSSIAFLSKGSLKYRTCTTGVLPWLLRFSGNKTSGRYRSGIKGRKLGLNIESLYSSYSMYSESPVHIKLRDAITEDINIAYFIALELHFWTLIANLFNVSVSCSNYQMDWRSASQHSAETQTFNSFDNWNTQLFFCCYYLRLIKIKGYVINLSLRIVNLN